MKKHVENIVQLFMPREQDHVSFVQGAFTQEQQDALDEFSELLQKFSVECEDLGLPNQAFFLQVLSKAINHSEYEIYHSTAVMMNVLGKILKAKMGW